MNNSARRLTVTLGDPGIWITPGDRSREGFEWLGLIRRGDGETGGLARIKTTGQLVQVCGGAVRSLGQRKAEIALAEANANAS